MSTENFKKQKSLAPPILKRLIIPMSILVVFEILLLVGSIVIGGLTSSLDQNAKNILHEKVVNRENYLQNEMVENWSNINLTVETVTKKALALDKKGLIDLKKIDESSEQCAPLLDAISGDLISMMRTNRVTGAFVLFNKGDLSKEKPTKKPGLYFRDLDPESAASSNNGDLLLKCAPISLVKKLGIPTDSAWKPQFDFSEQGYKKASFFYKPYQNALTSPKDLTITDLGYWSTPFCPGDSGDSSQVVTYSVPLRLSDGTVYGILGIDITLDYLQKLLPYDELTKDKQGAYILALQKGNTLDFTNLLVNGPVYAQAVEGISNPKITGDGKGTLDYFLSTGQNGGDFYCTAEQIVLYNTNTAFSSDQWVLIGAVKSNALFAESHRVTTVLAIALALTLLLGIVGSVLISYRISKPVVRLSKDMKNADPKEPVVLAPTSIREIDQLSSSIENLSRNIIDVNNKFTQILEMASVKLAGFNINRTNNTIFLSNQFFDVFNKKGVDAASLTTEEFSAMMKEFDIYKSKDSTLSVTLYEIPNDNGISYVQLKYIHVDEHHIGLAEDITQTVLERRLIEHERDHDPLTGLINRRAFHRKMNQLFYRDTHLLKIAALVMMDLDNLKYTNDTYGHDCGDKYIKSAADCFVCATPPGTVISRISGDEFYLFFYGYNNRSEIYKVFASMKEYIDHTEFILPDSQKTRIRVTGGISWYPKDSSSYEELVRYSDFAMYKTKRSAKGQFSDFDIGDYNQEAYSLQSRIELKKLLDEQLVEYHFQPIVSVSTGQIFAYEALMRANMPTLRTPYDILTVAKEEGKLSQIEQLTAFKSFEAYTAYMRSGIIKKDCKLFFNSLPNQLLSSEDLKKIESMYGEYLQNVVFEITEEEHLIQTYQNEKMKFMNKWGCGLALDDYGSGYNSEKALLELCPDYVKVDMNIIRGIDQDVDKQEILCHIVTYGHERGMKIIAEGVESPEEALTVIRLGTDYLQGFYFAKPAVSPPEISPDVSKMLVAAYKERL